MKKLLAIFTVFIIIFLCSCSKESKFGVQQFVVRMNDNFNTNYTTSEFMLSKKNDDNFLFLTKENHMITLTLDSKNNINGISLLLTADGDIENAKLLYCQMCSVFTGNDYESQLKIFNDSQFFSEEIKFVAGNFYKMGKEQLQKLDVNVLEEILRSDDLKADTEDDIYELVQTMAKKDITYCCLFEYVHFEYLSMAQMKSLIEAILICFLAVVVGVILISIIQPMFSIYGQIQ